MAKHREALPRLNIPVPLSMQQPIAQGMYSPALPTTLQQSFHPAFPLPSSLQTPMQAFFTSQPPPAPGRPTHRQGQASIAQLAAAGIHPPNGYVNPVGGHLSRPSMMLGPGQILPGQSAPSHPFPNRNRRQLSIGGPPKAVLGGPARKLSPNPITPAAPTVQAPKVKKIVVNLPKETFQGGLDISSRPSWARTPFPSKRVDKDVLPVESTTAEPYPSDVWRYNLPEVVDVYLPGKIEWENMKKAEIEEKLEKLGVERGSGSNVPHIHAPHARAASISSPADPALLLFKLSKLQQAQDASSTSGSLSTSPQPRFGLSPSPFRNAPPRFVDHIRHGHTMSLAQPPSYQSAYSRGHNPFGPDAILGSDNPPDIPYISTPPPPVQNLRPPHSYALTGAPPLSAVGGDSRPDFVRGFGLDIPEEEEGEEEAVRERYDVASDDGDATQDMELDEQVDNGDVRSIVSPNSRNHSRHVSRISVALSLRSVGGSAFNTGHKDESTENTGDLDEMAQRNDKSPEEGDLDNAVEEWTGSEDAYIGTEASDDESIGEWSNPSDEERARKLRAERRIHRQASRQEDKPRRLPNFPRPPESAVMLPRRDDDIISNPSDEGLTGPTQQGDYLSVAGEYYSRPPSNMSIRSNRPLPPLPHSRSPSGQHSVHDPAQAHSRTPSETFTYPEEYHSQPPFARRESLNPNAKPFVFGAAGSWPIFGGTAAAPGLTPPNAPLMSHSRLPSFGKPLNVAAPEFKPGGFTFCPPPGVPQMPVPGPGLSRPLPVPPSEGMEGSPFKVQGREKRQRTESTTSIEEGDSMTSFRFPANIESPRSIRRKLSGSFNHRLNPSAEPFSFPRTNAVTNVPHVVDGTASANMDDSVFDEHDSTARAENGDAEVEESNIPPMAKAKPGPITLDLKRGNTVPAGLFRSLVNGGDDRIRRAVRSRLSSREIFEHTQRPSMDDINVMSISRNMRVTDEPVHSVESPMEDDDVFASARHNRRRSSLPDLRDEISEVGSRISVPPQDLTSRMEIHHVEQVVGSLLDEKFAILRDELTKYTGGQGLKSSTEDMIADVVSLFRTQLQESAGKSLDESQMDARGEMDFQLIKGIVEEGHKELLSVMKKELQGITNHIPDVLPTSNMTFIVEDVGKRTVSAVVDAISKMSAKQDAVNQIATARDRDVLIDKLTAVLTPIILSLHTKPIDYTFLTTELTQAVKPHISQLIDLASDKRETAGLIVDRLTPLLPSLSTPPIDTDAITSKLITEVLRAIAPIDAFEIKEQVADLVVERLDSRLAVRDKALNADSISNKVVESVTQLHAPLQQLPETLQKLVEGQEASSGLRIELVVLQDAIKGGLTEIKESFDARLEHFNATQVEIISNLNKSAVPASEPDENLLLLKASVEKLAADQMSLLERNDELLAAYNGNQDKFNTLPESVSRMGADIQKSFVDLLTSRDSVSQEMEELRKLNADYQVQVTKARSAHGQVRVEKDVLIEKIGVIEGDRERLKGQVKELQNATTAKDAETTALEAKNKELEEALAKALARLQTSDVTAQTSQQQITDLEKANRELLAEMQALKSRADSLELQVTFATRDKDAVSHSLEVLQKQYDNTVSQQTHWDDLRQASEKIDMLTDIIGQAEELNELRRHRDRHRILEGDHATLQKRFKELEAKVSTSERAATTTRQSLTQAQQRSAEWERRAKDYESQLDDMQTKLDHTEQMHAQLEADMSLTKLQLEEREADDRLSKDRESKLREQISLLESKASRLQTELEQVKNTKPSGSIQYRNITNGVTHPPPRPDSRASTIDNRSSTPTRRTTSYTSSIRSDTPPQPSVWDSMHAPTNTNVPSKYISPAIHAPAGRYPQLGPSTPKARRPLYPQYQRSIAPSPTPSVVSVAPTQGEDGWWI